ncbi:MAG TPA: hypothetical protein VK181_09755 [Rhizobium sp.]|nr:hypothetical protein [Rhizobium sp.]
MSDQSTSMQKRRGTTAGQPRSYSVAEWAKGYAAWLLVLPLYLGLWAFATVFKRIPPWAVRKLLRAHEAVTYSRKQDVRIPGDPSVQAYMRRWWRIPRNAFFNIYYHIVERSDEDRALHDHPWWNFSIVLQGGYYEHLILPGGVHQKTWYGSGSVRFRRSGNFAHRLELLANGGNMSVVGAPQELPAKTIFITGPVLRRWGFHAKDRWVDAYDWDAYLAEQGQENRLPMSGYTEQLEKAGQ